MLSYHWMLLNITHWTSCSIFPHPSRPPQRPWALHTRSCSACEWFPVRSLLSRVLLRVRPGQHPAQKRARGGFPEPRWELNKPASTSGRALTPVNTGPQSQAPLFPRYDDSSGFLHCCLSLSLGLIAVVSHIFRSQIFTHTYEWSRGQQLIQSWQD